MDDTTPATKADINGLKDLIERVEASNLVVKSSTERLETCINRVEASVGQLADSLRQFEKSIHGRFERIGGDMDNVLAVLGSVDNRLTDSLKDHEQRITRLERQESLAS